MSATFRLANIKLTSNTITIATQEIKSTCRVIHWREGIYLERHKWLWNHKSHIFHMLLCYYATTIASPHLISKAFVFTKQKEDIFFHPTIVFLQHQNHIDLPRIKSHISVLLFIFLLDVSLINIKAKWI